VCKSQTGVRFGLSKIQSAKSKSKLLYDWQFTANQFCLGFKALETHDQRFFQLNSYSNSPYVTSYLTRRWVCLLWICLAFRQMYVSYIYQITENYSFCIIYKSSVSIGFAKQIMPILRILCYNVSLVTWIVLSLTITKFKPFIFSITGFALSYTTNIFILMILYDFSVLPTWFYYIILYIWKVWKPFANRGPVYTLKNFKWCGKPCFVGAAILRGKCLPLFPRRSKHKSLLIISASYGGLV
jgi:hypothetical protein